jgi:predicted outer membrane repeat protein
VGTDSSTEDPVFTIAAFCKCPGPANATIQGVTVTGGDPDENGGAFFVENAGPGNLATLHLFDSTITGNQSENDGGGIFNEGIVDVQRVTFSNNFAEADGSAIATKSEGNTINLRGSTQIDQNFATASVVNSTIVGNTSDSDTGCIGGGAIDQAGGNTTIVNSTIVGNTSNDGTCEVVQPTGGGLNIESGPASIVNMIVVGNTASPGDERLARSGPRAAASPGRADRPSNCSADTSNEGNPASLTSLVTTSSRRATVASPPLAISRTSRT